MTILCIKFRVTLVAAWLCFLASSFAPLEAFVPSNNARKGSIWNGEKSALSAPETQLRMSADLDKEVKVVAPGEEDNNAPATRSPAVIKLPKSFEKVFMFSLRVYNAFVMTAGTFFTCMLLLNLFGYDYTYSREEGFRVDTIQHLRTEKQFRKAAEAYAASSKVSGSHGQSGYVQPDGLAATSAARK